MSSSASQHSRALRFPKVTPAGDAEKSASELIDQRIAELADWRGALLAHLRQLVMGAAPEIAEEWKWNTPVWSCDGIICTGETYKRVVKLTFAKGASLPDTRQLFHSSLDGKTRRAIDFSEGASVNADALQELVLTAVSLNKA